MSPERPKPAPGAFPDSGEKDKPVPDMFPDSKDKDKPVPPPSSEKSETDTTDKVDPRTPATPETEAGTKEKPDAKAKRREKVEKEIAELEGNIRKSGQSFPSKLACMKIDRDYGKLVIKKTERFLISDTQKNLFAELQAMQKKNGTRFTRTAYDTIRNILKLFTFTPGKPTPLMQRFQGIPRMRVRFLDDRIQEIKHMLPSALPGQKPYLQKLIATLQSLIDIDPMAKAQLEAQKNKPPSVFSKKFGRSARFLGLIAAAGMGLLTLIANRGKPSLPTALYAGLAIALYKGKLLFANKHNQLFQVELSNVKALEVIMKEHGIKGKEWSTLIGSIMSDRARTALRNLEATLKKHERTLKDPKSSDEDREKAEKGKVQAHEKFAKSIASKNSPANKQFREMATEKRIHLCKTVQKSRSPEARAIIMQIVEHNMGPHMLEDMVGKAP